MSNSWPNEAYTRVELDGELLRILRAYEKKGGNLLLSHKEYDESDNTEFEKHLTKMRYLKAFGYVEIDAEKRTEPGWLIFVSVRITDLGVRFLADGGFVGKHNREVVKKKWGVVEKAVTWGLSVIAIVVSAFTYFRSPDAISTDPAIIDANKTSVMIIDTFSDFRESKMIPSTKKDTTL